MPYALAGDPGEHPAAVAWSLLRGDEAVPTAIHVLRKARGGSDPRAVYRLEDVGHAGTAVIAKRCRGDGGHLEGRIYETVLPALPLVGLRSYGSAGDPDGQSSWIFLEEATGAEYSRHDRAHAELAGRFLTTLHATAQTVPALSRLPDRGPAYHKGLLESAQDSIGESRSNPALSERDVDVLNRISSQFDCLSSRWDGLEAVCSELPETLVHGDFVSKNLRVQKRDGQMVLLAFDWEEAGRGPPAIDIGKPDPNWTFDFDIYRESVRQVWPESHVAALPMFGSIGTALRCIRAVGWAASSLKSDWIGPAMDKMRAYESRLSSVLELVPWAD